MSAQSCINLAFKLFLRNTFFTWNCYSSYSSFLCTFQSICISLITDNNSNFQR